MPDKGTSAETMDGDRSSLLTKWGCIAAIWSLLAPWSRRKNGNFDDLEQSRRGLRITGYEVNIPPGNIKALPKVNWLRSTKLATRAQLIRYGG